MTAETWPCNWCGRYAHHDLIDTQYFTAPSLWRRWCSQQCRTAWLDQQHSTQHVNAWGQS